MNCRKTRDLKFFSAGRGLDFHFIAHFFAEQRAANGRRSGNHAFGDIRFFRCNQLVFGFLGLAEFQEAHGGTVGGTIVRKIVEVEHGNFRHAAMQLAESRGDEGLALLGVFVLGIFGEVAVGAGLHELFGELIVKFMFELRDFSLQLPFEFFADVYHFVLCGTGPAQRALFLAFQCRGNSLIPQRIGFTPEL
jgi:hypothetical protein